MDAMIRDARQLVPFPGLQRAELGGGNEIIRCPRQTMAATKEMPCR